MIGMRIVPVRREEDPWRAGPQHSHHCLSGLFTEDDVTIRLFQIKTRIQAHCPRGFKRFFGANFRRAAGAHLSLG